jgi:hypothetical protein
VRERSSDAGLLETQRLVLRRFALADVDNLVSLDAILMSCTSSLAGYPRREGRSNKRSARHSLTITSVTGVRLLGAHREAHREFPGWFHFRVLTGPWPCCRPGQGVVRIPPGNPSGSLIGLPGVLVAVLIGATLFCAAA